MGTRATYSIIEIFQGEDGKKKRQSIVHLYTQYDGYPDGKPLDFVEFINGGELVNGFSVDSKFGKVFNGAGCFAAQLISEFKTDVGNFYVITKGFTLWEEFHYEFIADTIKKEFKIVAYDIGEKKKKIFEGTPTEYIEKYGDSDS